MKHPVLGVLSIFSISVYAASIPDYVENTPLLVKRQVYPEDPSTDSMYQSQNPEGGPFDPSSPQLGMMPPNVDPFTQNIYGDPGSNTGPFSGSKEVLHIHSMNPAYLIIQLDSCLEHQAIMAQIFNLVVNLSNSLKRPTVLMQSM
ncbi:hypothetical protein BSLG_002666 [Batrachochytrium salamandrivorans]|nr:hypothetical protein BSLG_002666 [Batrachochytrium salamandrivorans]